MKAIKAHLYILNIIWSNNKLFIFFETFNSLLGKLKQLIYYILLFGQIFNLLQSNQPLTSILFWLVLAVLFSLFTQMYQSWYQNIYRPRAIIQLNTKMSRMLFEKAATVDIKYYEIPEYYNKYTVSLGEANSRIDNSIALTANIITGFVMICIYLYLIILRDYFAIILTVVPLISVFVFGNKLNKIGYKLYQENIPPSRRKDYVQRTVYLKDYTKEFRISNISNVLNKYFTSSIQQIIKNIKSYGKKIALLQFLNSFFSTTFMLLSAVLYGAYLMMVPHTLDIGSFYILVASIFNLLRVLLDFSNGIVQIRGNKLYIANFIAFLSYQNEIQNQKNKTIPDKENTSIEFKNVSFKYPSTDTYAIKNLYLKIHKGQKVAIVGENGSGKTTLIKLLLHLYDVSDGEIKYGNLNIKLFDINLYRNLYGINFQDSRIFAMNVMENVLLTDEKINEDIDNDELVTSSLKASGLYNKIYNNGGLHKQVTREFEEDGLVLSGGEQQMLSLSRIFVSEYPIVILDEPTSALDPMAEENLFNNMLDICKDKTVIFISHRLSSAKIADKIFFMKDGTIVEEGSHKELIIKKGLYADMFISQAKSYQEGFSNETDI
jgi:ATP-binding cassette subfamily B protein